MNWRAIQAIVRRDLLIVMRSKGVLLPLILMPILVTVVLPGFIGGLAPMLAEMPGSSMSDISTFLETMPAAMQEKFSGYNETQTMVVLVLTYFFAPMFLIMPLMVASTIAANSFAGEKERKTLEALIYTPTSDATLFMGKILAAWIPAVLVALGSFVLYGIVANLAAWPTMQKIFFPNAMWIAMVLWVSPAAAGLGLGSMVLVSSKTNSFQEAYQIGSIVVLPIVILILGQASGVMYLNVGVALLLGLILWLIDACILYFAVRTFRRTEIIARL